MFNSKKFFLTGILLILGVGIAKPYQQLTLTGMGGPPSSGFPPITLDASCTGTSTTSVTPCSSAMTVTAGDAITCNITASSGGNFMAGVTVDGTNGYYENVFGIVHPAGTLDWNTTSIKQNSAGGSITPIAIYTATPLRATISCYAWKGVPTSNALDGGAVEQTTSATVTNPTSGTAAAPTNNNEAVVAWMSRSSSTAPSSGGGSWLPAGTLTLVGTSSVRQASEYQIQTTATAVNGPFTGNSTSIATVDTQLAVLRGDSTGGYRSLGGIFIPLGAPGSAPTGTMSAASIGAATSTLSSVNTSGFSWTLNGTPAPTYDTTINPTGTRSVMVQGVTHTFGDAGSSMLVAGTTGTSNFSFGNQTPGTGAPHWFSLFYRMASGGAEGNNCDIAFMSGAATEPQMIFQAGFISGSNFTMKMEGSSPAYGSAASSTLSTDTDYWVQEHVAGVNERNHQLLFYTKSGSTWSLASTLNLDVLCSNAATASCSSAPVAASTTGTASSGSTALTVASGTGIVLGQVVTGAGIADPSQTGNPSWTVVAAVSGTSVTLSQNTTASLSGTAVAFYTPPAHFVAGTNGTISAGSTSLTVVTPGTGTIAVGQSVGGAGIVQGATVTAVSLPTVTLDIPATSAMTNGGVTFWSNPSTSNISFGKNAGGSCGITANQWWSGMFYDPYGTWGAFAPN